MKENCTFLTSSWGEMYILVAAVVLTPCQGLANIELSGMCMCALKKVIAEKTEFKEKHCHQLSADPVFKNEFQNHFTSIWDALDNVHLEYPIVNAFRPIDDLKVGKNAANILRLS